MLSVVAAADERDVLPARGAHREDVLKKFEFETIKYNAFA